MSDLAFATALRDRLAAIEAEIMRLTQERQAVENLLVVHSPTNGKPVEVSQKPQATTSRAKRVTQRDQVVEIVLAIIERKDGPTNVEDLWAEVQGKVDCSKQQFYQHLAGEAGRNDNPRIRRTMQGVYDKRSIAKKVPVDRSPEETRIVLDQARKNAERSLS